MHLFGEHATYVHLLLVPLVPFFGPLVGLPQLLVLVQSAALGLSGLLLHRLARRELGAMEARLVLAAYLLYPALQYTWLEYYEPVNLAIPFLIAAYASIEQGRDRSALVWCLLALVTMENLAVTVVALGVWAFVRGRRALGGVLVVGSTLYILVLLGVVFPWLEPGGYVYGHRLWGERDGLPEVVAGLLSRLATPENARYLLALLIPAGLLPLLAPGAFLLAAQLPLNMVSAWPYAHEIRYHYVAPVIPFVWLGVARALAHLPAGTTRRRLGVGALVAGALVGQLAWASPWLAPREGQNWWRGVTVDRLERREILSLLTRVSEDAVVSADYRFLPHLARRDQLFMFPDLGPSGAPDLVLVDSRQRSPNSEESRVLDRVREAYEETARTAGGTVLLRRRGYRPSPSRPVSPTGRPTAPGEGSPG